MHRKIFFLFLILLLPCLQVNANAEMGNQRDASVIHVSGEASTFITPDQALIGLGITTEAATAVVATTENANKMATVLSAIRKLRLQEKDIKTQGYTLGPIYSHSRDARVPIRTGYTVSNFLQVRLDDLSKVGTVIDAAVVAGVNNVRDVQFVLKDDFAAKQEALYNATLEARKKAQAIAETLGLQTGGVISVEEGYPLQRAMLSAAAPMSSRSAAPLTSVNPGMIEIHATVMLNVAMVNCISPGVQNK
jgi:uncharacterized protein YggE